MSDSDSIRPSQDGDNLDREPPDTKLVWPPPGVNALAAQATAFVGGMLAFGALLADRPGLALGLLGVSLIFQGFGLARFLADRAARQDFTNRR